MVTIRVWGPFALFCPAELRADPYSEPVMTPSAAKGLLRAIYWKPEFEYEIRAIHVLEPIRRTAASAYALKRPNTTAGAAPQAKSVLVDVNYGIEAAIRLNPHRADRPLHSYYAEAQRRMRAGEVFRQPCFGRAEYPADYEWSDPATWEPISEDMDLGPTLLDQVMVEEGRKDDRGFSAMFIPVYYPLVMTQGVVHIPPEAYTPFIDRIFRMRAKVHPRKTPEERAR